MHELFEAQDFRLVTQKVNLSLLAYGGTNFDKSIISCLLKIEISNLIYFNLIDDGKFHVGKQNGAHTQGSAYCQLILLQTGQAVDLLEQK